MKRVWVFSLFLLSCSVGCAETAAQSALGKTFFADVDSGVASTWFLGGRPKYSGKEVRVELSLAGDGSFEYRVDGKAYRGSADPDLLPGSLALYFDDNTHLPENSFIPIRVSSDGSHLINPIFSLGPEGEVPKIPQAIAVFRGTLDETSAAVWWKEVFWRKSDEMVPAQIVFLEGELFRYEVAGETRATGTFSMKELERGRRSYRLTFDEPKDRAMNANFDPKAHTLSFNYGIRFTLKRQ